MATRKPKEVVKIINTNPEIYLIKMRVTWESLAPLKHQLDKAFSKQALRNKGLYTENMTTLYIDLKARQRLKNKIAETKHYYSATITYYKTFFKKQKNGRYKPIKNPHEANSSRLFCLCKFVFTRKDRVYQLLKTWLDSIGGKSFLMQSHRAVYPKICNYNLFGYKLKE